LVRQPALQKWNSSPPGMTLRFRGIVVHLADRILDLRRGVGRRPAESRTTTLGVTVIVMVMIHASIHPTRHQRGSDTMSGSNGKYGQHEERQSLLDLPGLRPAVDRAFRATRPVLGPAPHRASRRPSSSAARQAPPGAARPRAPARTPGRAGSGAMRPGRALPRTRGA